MNCLQFWVFICRTDKTRVCAIIKGDSQLIVVNHWLKKKVKVTRRPSVLQHWGSFLFLALPLSPKASLTHLMPFQRCGVTDTLLTNMETDTLAHILIDHLVHRGKQPTLGGIRNAAHAKRLYRLYRRGSWRDRVYRAVFHACPD